VLRVLLVLTGVVQLFQGRRALGVWLIAVPVAENVVAPFSKYLLNRPRPHWLHPIAVEHSTSYPSGHAAGAGMFACAVALAVLTTVRGAAARWALLIGGVVVALVISVDRIFLGVHYLSDVVGGILLGVAITLAAWLVLLMVQRRRAARALLRR
jgi:undecaprenyl-diphosphatase